MIISTQCPGFPESQKFTLKSPGDDLGWKKCMFSDEQLKALRKLLQEKKACEITVPMPILKKNEKRNASFKVLIRRYDLQKPMRPVFYRAGLLIDDVSTDPLNTCVAAVLIKRDDLADLLVSAEPPSHSKWNYDTDRVKNGYDKPRSHIRFVSRSVRHIIDIINTSGQDRNWDPLSDIFGIKKARPDTENNDGKKAGDGKDGNESGGKEETQSEKLRIVTISEINGDEKGIKVKPGDGLLKVPDEKFPFTAKFSVGYDTFRGLDWTPNDFDLGTGFGGVSVAVKEGTVKPTCKGNQVTLTISDRSRFVVAITGFDPNRDITAAKLRYEYRKEAADGVSV